MRPSNKQRSRNKPGSSNHNNNNNNNQRRGSMGNIINRVFESAGPDGKVRGTPQQIIDKYQALARDAQVAGDRVAAESYLQHSEHYSRLLGEAQRQQAENRFQQERDDGQQQQRGDENQQQRPHEGQGGQQGRQPAMAAPLASGLTTIDPDDYDMAGPIETPEGRQRRGDEPVPVARAEQPQPQAAPVNGTEYGQGQPGEGEAGPIEQPAKRSRPRRRAKAEAPASEAVPQAD